MSLLDTIKNLFCNNSCEKVETEQDNKASETVENTASEAKSEVKEAAKPAAGLKIPEDSTLKRHFISALRVEIESGMPPRPTDATLRSQYDAEVQVELDKLLG
jgi:hypothetical protein